MNKQKIYLSNYDCEVRAQAIAKDILRRHEYDGSAVVLYGVPRGGIPVAYLVGAELQGAGNIVAWADTPDNAHYIIDDIIDSGATQERYRKYNRPFYSLVNKEETEEGWYVFPWEVKEGQDESATDIPTRLLQYIGEDVTREGLQETPKRFLKAWEEYTCGYKIDPKTIVKAFKDGAEKVDEMVLVKDIPIYSHCEHHLAPMFGIAHIAYIPDGKVLGLSKFARLADVFAKRLQVQERMTQQIAHCLNDELKPKGVAVVLELRHMCMEQRGVRARGSSTTTSCLIGVFKEAPAVRAEFMGLIK
jgi:GTP cyclohydrolase I